MAPRRARQGEDGWGAIVRLVHGGRPAGGVIAGPVLALDQHGYTDRQLAGDGFPSAHGLDEGVAEGTVWDLSSSGWRASGTAPVTVGMEMPVCLYLGNEKRWVSIGRAAVRWVKGSNFGLEVVQTDPSRGKPRRARFCGKCETGNQQSRAHCDRTQKIAPIRQGEDFGWHQFHSYRSMQVRIRRRPQLVRGSRRGRSVRNESGGLREETDLVQMD